MDPKKIAVVYAYDVKYTRVWLKSILVCLILWLAPYFCGKYTDRSFAYIAKEDIVQELVGSVGASNDGLPWCPAVSPHLQEKNSLLNNDVQVLPEEEVVKTSNIQEGGTWKPQDCHSRYQVSNVPGSLVFT